MLVSWRQGRTDLDAPCGLSREPGVQQRTHHARKAVFLESGRRPTESFEHMEHRRAREQRIVRRNPGSSLYDDFRAQRGRPLKPLYPV
jgi:hypothetical protein